MIIIIIIITVIVLSAEAARRTRLARNSDFDANTRAHVRVYTSTRPDKYNYYNTISCHRRHDVTDVVVVIVRRRANRRPSTAAAVTRAYAVTTPVGFAYPVCRRRRHRGGRKESCGRTARSCLGPARRCVS